MIETSNDDENESLLLTRERHGRSGSIDRLRKWTDVDSDDSFGDIDPGNVDLGLKLKSSHNSSKSHRRGLSISSDDSPSKNALKGRVTNAQLQQYADDEDETDDLEEVILEAKKMHGGEEEGEHKDEGDDDGLSLESLSLRSVGYITNCDCSHLHF